MLGVSPVHRDQRVELVSRKNRLSVVGEVLQGWERRQLLHGREVGGQ